MIIVIVVTFVLHRRRSRAEATRLAESISLGDSRDAVITACSAEAFSNVTCQDNGNVIAIDTAFEFHPGWTWIVYVALREDRVSAIRFRTRGEPERRPSGAPPDRGAP
ncbi:MAG: hypothetical protein IPG04_10520 [Polyangiaceae bacterium]|nr:hypothetical protein [Polyangiaceae bacterium]